MPVVLTVPSSASLAIQNIGVVPANERVGFDLRYSYRRADAALDPIVEGPYFRITPALDSPNAELRGQCGGDPGMSPNLVPPVGGMTGWRDVVGVPGDGDIKSLLSAQVPYYEIDAQRGCSIACPVPFSLDVVSSSVGTYVWETYRYAAGMSLERNSARAVQTRMVAIGATRTLTVPRGAHRFALWGSPTTLSLNLETTSKGSSSLTVFSAFAVTPILWGQYASVMNAVSMTVTANGINPTIISFEVELP